MDKMKHLSKVLLVGAILLTGWARAENKMPMMSADDLAAQFGEAGEIDEATRGRGCKIKNFGKVIACELIAGRATVENLVVNQDVIVYGNEEIAGDLTVDGNELVRGNVQIDGNLTVLGNYVPLTFNLLPGTNVISTVLDGLSNDNQNFGSVLINLAPGTYLEDDFSFTNQVQAVTFVGDTNPLAGVSFEQGGIYDGTALDIQNQLNGQIGIGCNYDIGFDATGTIMTVTANSTACTEVFSVVQPNFASPVSLVGHTLLFIGTGGVTATAVVTAAAGNTITLNTAIGGSLSGTTVSSTTSTLGVAFVVIPNVQIADNGTSDSNFVGIKNLKFQGIWFNWGGSTNDLYLGGVNTKMELSNCLFNSPTTALHISANQAYNRQPNTFIGTTIIDNTCTPDFVFNGVWGGAGLQVFGASGTFSYAQYAESALALRTGAHINADFSRFHGEIVNETAVTVTDGSTLIMTGGQVTNATLQAGTTGVAVADSSVLVANNLVVRNFVLGLQLNFASAGLIFGVTNPAFFSGNTNDLQLDGAPYMNITVDYMSGNFGSNNSYVRTL